jgi:outer membrane lipopolysaccharide assembly protein LptE/RlpB
MTLEHLDELEAFSRAMKAHRDYADDRKKALGARDRNNTRLMGRMRGRCERSLIEELAATNAAGIVGKADPEYVNKQRGQ